ALARIAKQPRPRAVPGGIRRRRSAEAGPRDPRRARARPARALERIGRRRARRGIGDLDEPHRRRAQRAGGAAVPERAAQLPPHAHGPRVVFAFGAMRAVVMVLALGGSGCEFVVEGLPSDGAAAPDLAADDGRPPPIDLAVPDGPAPDLTTTSP